MGDMRTGEIYEAVDGQLRNSNDVPLTREQADEFRQLETAQRLDAFAELKQRLQGQTSPSVLDEVGLELANARATHAPMSGHHEGYAGGSPKAKHCHIVGTTAYWESFAGQQHLVECGREDHLIHHQFVTRPFNVEDGY